MRSSLNYAVAKYGKIGEAVEVGVRDGSNAEEILKQAKFVSLVDNYPVYEDKGVYIVHMDEAVQESLKNRMLERIKKYGDSARWINQSSTYAAQQFTNKSIDYVYIDACHDYANVLEDIRAWYPKAKLLAGHDFGKPHFPGVTKAVMEFAREKELKVVYSADSDWWYKQRLRVVSYVHKLDKFKPYTKFLADFSDSVKNCGYELTCHEVNREDIGVKLVNRRDFTKPGRVYYIQGKNKPGYIRSALNDYKEDIVWMDIDTVMQRELGYPLRDCDVAVTLRRPTDRIRGKEFFEGYLNTGVMFFRNNTASRKFCDLWAAEIKENECDQDGANKLLLKYSKLEERGEIINVEGIRVKALPVEEYNFFYFPGDCSNARVLHFKGLSYRGEYKN